MHGKRMPECRAHHDCFANHDGVCHCLNDNNFNGKDCPFYKTAETVQRESGLGNSIANRQERVDFQK